MRTNREERKMGDDRVPYPATVHSFAELTGKALEAAEYLDPPYADLLRLLEDCEPATGGMLADRQRRGASYRTLAFIAFEAGLDLEERRDWYELARRIPLTQRHAGHIIARLPEWG